MSDRSAFSELLSEREAIRDTLASWWERWTALYRRELGDGDPGAALYPIDDWARETPEQTAARIADRAAETPSPKAPPR